MEDRPLLSLVMIVKNESRSIRAIADSVRGHIDRWTILDTGSTDGTQELIREAFKGIDGELLEEPFVDFATTRNRSLELAGEKSVFALMLSGDETLVNGAALRAFCEKHRHGKGPAHGAYYVKVHFGSSIYDHARLTRTDAGWKYVGVTHEVIVKEKSPPPTIRVPDAYIVHDVSHRDPKAARNRWQLDLRLLSDEHRKNPRDTRTVFYLAQTHECLGQHQKANALYEKRAKMGGWQEEVYESLFRMGRTAQAMNRPWPEVQQLYLNAYSHSCAHGIPRAEPLYAVAWFWYQQKNHALTFLFAQRGVDTPFPEKATLFVEADVYKHKLHDLVGTAAFYLKEFDAGERALRKALESLPNDARLKKNLAFYEERKKKAVRETISSNSSTHESAEHHAEAAATPVAEAAPSTATAAETSPAADSTESKLVRKTPAFRLVRSTPV